MMNNPNPGTDFLLFEELSEQEMESISGGQGNQNEFPGQRGLVNANVIVQDIDVAAAVLSERIEFNQ